MSRWYWRSYPFFIIDDVIITNTEVEAEFQINPDTDLRCIITGAAPIEYASFFIAIGRLRAELWGGRFLASFQFSADLERENHT